MLLQLIVDWQLINILILSTQSNRYIRTSEGRSIWPITTVLTHLLFLSIQEIGLPLNKSLKKPSDYLSDLSQDKKFGLKIPSLESYTITHTISLNSLDIAIMSCSGQMMCKFISTLVKTWVLLRLSHAIYQRNKYLYTTSYLLIYHHCTSLIIVLDHISHLIFRKS